MHDGPIGYGVQLAGLQFHGSLVTHPSIHPSIFTTFHQPTNPVGSNGVCNKGIQQHSLCTVLHSMLILKCIASPQSSYGSLTPGCPQGWWQVYEHHMMTEEINYLNIGILNPTTSPRVFFYFGNRILIKFRRQRSQHLWQTLVALNWMVGFGRSVWMQIEMRRPRGWLLG